MVNRDQRFIVTSHGHDWECVAVTLVNNELCFNSCPGVYAEPLLYTVSVPLGKTDLGSDHVAEIRHEGGSGLRLLAPCGGHRGLHTSDRPHGIRMDKGILSLGSVKARQEF